MSTIGSRIRERRIHAGLSVDELAEKLGKDRATIYRYESDAIENFPISVISPLAIVLETTPAYLMGWDSMDASAGSEIEKSATMEDDGLSEKKRILIESIKHMDDSDIDVIAATADVLIAKRAK